MSIGTYPPVSAATIDEVRQQRRTLDANPELLTPPAELGLSERYIFRTQPGTVRMVTHTIPQPPMAGLDEKKERYFRREWERRMVRTFKVAGKQETDQQIIARAEKYYANVTEHNDGSSTIRFNRVPKRNECFLATNDTVLGDYIRTLVKGKVGEFAYVYEQNGRSRIVVGAESEQAKSFPNTHSGRLAAYGYADEFGLSDIKIVDD